MYGTRNDGLSYGTKRDRFSDLLSTMAQTNNLNTYIEPKPLWQDTHEVSQGLEHDTFGDLSICVYVNDTYAYVSTRHFLVFQPNHASNLTTKYMERLVSPWGKSL